MANNRMWLKCEHCGKQILLAKYYPSSNWQMRPDINPPEKTDEFFLEHRHLDFSDDGPTHFKIQYESEVD